MFQPWPQSLCLPANKAVDIKGEKNTLRAFDEKGLYMQQQQDRVAICNSQVSNI